MHIRFSLSLLVPRFLSTLVLNCWLLSVFSFYFIPPVLCRLALLATFGRLELCSTSSSSPPSLSAFSILSSQMFFFLLYSFTRLPSSTFCSSFSHAGFLFSPFTFPASRRSLLHSRFSFSVCYIFISLFHFLTSQSCFIFVFIYFYLSCPECSLPVSLLSLPRLTLVLARSLSCSLARSLALPLCHCSVHTLLTPPTLLPKQKRRAVLKLTFHQSESHTHTPPTPSTNSWFRTLIVYTYRK